MIRDFSSILLCIPFYDDDFFLLFSAHAALCFSHGTFSLSQHLRLYQEEGVPFFLVHLGLTVNRNTEGFVSVVLGIYRYSINRHLRAVNVVRYDALALVPRSHDRILLSRLGIENS